MLIKTLFLVMIVCVSVQGQEGHECIYDNRGICIEDCPPNTKSYTSNCVDDTLSQATCRQPQQRSIGVWCDLSRCDCKPPKVWDEVTKKCVRITECSDQSVLEEHNVLF